MNRPGQTGSKTQSRDPSREQSPKTVRDVCERKLEGSDNESRRRDDPKKRGDDRPNLRVGAAL